MPVIPLPDDEFPKSPRWMRHALLVSALAGAGQEEAEAAVPAARLGIPLALPGAAEA
jgi:hypothetical protein